MPEFKQLSKSERPSGPDKYLLIEKFCDPGCGDKYGLSENGCDLHSEYTYSSLEGACARALTLAQSWQIAVVYLSGNCAPVLPSVGSEKMIMERARKDNH